MGVPHRQRVRGEQPNDLRLADPAGAVEVQDSLPPAGSRRKSWKRSTSGSRPTISFGKAASALGRSSSPQEWQVESAVR